MSTESRIEHRNNLYQKELSMRSPSRKDKSAIELRKKNRLANITRKRLSEDSFKLSLSDLPASHLSLAGDIFSSQVPASDQLTSIVNLILSLTDPNIICTYLKLLRSNLSNKNLLNSLINNHSNFIKCLFDLFDYENEDLKYELSWLLIVVTSKSMFEIINFEDIQKLVKVMRDGFGKKYTNHIVWILGNIASDHIFTRDSILRTDAPDLIISAILSKSIEESSLSITIWALSNFLRGSPLPDMKFIFEFINLIPFVQRIYSDNEKIMTELFWGITYILDCEAFIDKVLSVLPISLILKQTRKDSEIKKSALRILGNISNGNSSQTSLIVENGAVEVFFHKLLDGDRAVIRESLWALSNIAGNGEWCAKEIFRNKNFAKVLKFMDSEECEIKLEALFLVKNCVQNCGYYEVISITRKFVYFASSIVQVLDHENAQIIMLGLEIIDRVFEAEREKTQTFEEDERKFLKNFEELGGLDKLERLESHNNEEIYQKCVKIIRENWDYDQVICH